MEIEEFESSHSLLEPPVQKEIFYENLPEYAGQPKIANEVPSNESPGLIEEEELEIPKTKEEIAILSKLHVQVAQWKTQFPDTFEMSGVSEDQIENFSVEELQGFLHDLEVINDSKESFAAICTLVDWALLGVEKVGVMAGFKVQGFQQEVLANPDYEKARTQIVIKRAAGKSFTPEQRIGLVMVQALYQCHKKNTAKEQKEKLVEDPELVALLKDSSSSSELILE